MLTVSLLSLSLTRVFSHNTTIIIINNYSCIHHYISCGSANNIHEIFPIIPSSSPLGQSRTPSHIWIKFSAKILAGQARLVVTGVDEAYMLVNVCLRVFNLLTPQISSHKLVILRHCLHYLPGFSSPTVIADGSQT